MFDLLSTPYTYANFHLNITCTTLFQLDLWLFLLFLKLCLIHWFLCSFLWIRLYVLTYYTLKVVMLGPETKPSNFWVVLVILCWIGCSSITQIANKEVLNEGQSSIILGGHSITMWTDFYTQNKAGANFSCQYYCFILLFTSFFKILEFLW